MKVIYVGGECKFCCDHPNSDQWPDLLTEGRAYTVTVQRPMQSPSGFKGCGYLLAEVRIDDSRYWCSCSFREIDGDQDSWERIVEKSRPKTKELEPA